MWAQIWSSDFGSKFRSNIWNTFHFNIILVFVLATILWSICLISVWAKIFLIVVNLLRRYGFTPKNCEHTQGSKEEHERKQEEIQAEYQGMLDSIAASIDFKKVFNYLYETIRGLLIYAKEGDFVKMFIEENLID